MATIMDELPVKHRSEAPRVPSRTPHSVPGEGCRTGSVSQKEWFQESLATLSFIRKGLPTKLYPRLHAMNCAFEK